jgi:hypothetical protein
MRVAEEGEIESLAAAELVAALRQGFAGRPSVCMADLTKLLNLDEKTLLRHIRSGRLPFRPVGTGRKRIRRRFTMGDVLAFYGNLGTAMPMRPRGVRLPAPSAPVPAGLIGFIPRPVRPGRSP